MKNLYLTKLRYIDSLRCEKKLWLGVTDLWVHTLITRQILGQTDAIQRPGAKTELGPNMGLGVANYPNVIGKVFA